MNPRHVRAVRALCPDRTRAVQARTLPLPSGWDTASPSPVSVDAAVSVPPIAQCPWWASRAFHGTRALLEAARPTPPPAPQPSPAALPVTAELLEELRLCVARAPEGRWCAVSEVYSELPVSVRRQHVRPHGTMLRVLEKVQAELGITLSTSGVYYAKGIAPPEDGSGCGARALEEGVDRAEGTGASSTPRQVTGKPIAVTPAHPTSPEGVRTVQEDSPPPVDFYYDVGLDRPPPPPPPDFDVTPSALVPAQASADGSVLALGDLVPFIPPFFVPLGDALANLPGYTEAHLEAYLRTSRAFELVRVGGGAYVRLYGGYATINLDGCEVAEETFKRYKPDRALVPAFQRAFSGVVEEWMPLPMLLRRADPAAVARLPFRGPAAIIYFAQMQDVFAFSVNKDGVTASVMLRRPGYSGLEAETTPTPKSFNHVLRAVPLEGQTDVQVVLAALTDPVRAEIELYYGDLFNFLKAHAPMFFLSDDRSVVMRTRYRQRMHNASLPLEEQLRIALERRDKGKVRTLRRRIAFRDNPAHPFHDPDNLAREVAKYLPRKGFVTLRVFLKKHVPEDLLFFMPKKTYNFFSNYPQFFQQFEYQQAGTWAISRPGQPLPRGVIRSTFTESDLLALTAEQLQKKGSRSCTNIFLHLPRGAQEMIRKRHGGLFYFAKKYPEYFNVVLGSDTENRQSSAVVHLIQLPNVHRLQGADAVSGEGQEASEVYETAADEVEEGEDASSDADIHTRTGADEATRSTRAGSQMPGRTADGSSHSFS